MFVLQKSLCLNGFTGKIVHTDWVGLHNLKSQHLQSKIKLALVVTSLTLLYTGGDTLYPPHKFWAVEPSRLTQETSNFGTIPIL